MMDQGRMLVTGASSGLGKYLCDHFGGVGFFRNSSLSDLMKVAHQQPFKVIIHAAFNPRQDINTTNLPGYLDDTIFLTKKLLEIPHQTFIFISSCDVYPKESELCQEDQEIELKKVDSIYGITKLISESLVKEQANNPLILRPTALLGECTRKNSLIRLLTEKNAALTLSKKSTFNYVLHSDIAEFIERALHSQLTGIYNIASSKNVDLEEIAAMFHCAAHFGDYTYQTGRIDNHKATAILPKLSHTSLENVLSYQKLSGVRVYE